MFFSTQDSSRVKIEQPVLLLVSACQLRELVPRVGCFFPKALQRVLPENPLNTDTSTLTLTH